MSRPVDHESQNRSEWRLKARSAQDRFLWGQRGDSVEVMVRSSCLEASVVFVGGGILAVGLATVFMELVGKKLLSGLGLPLE